MLLEWTMHIILDQRKEKKLFYIILLNLSTGLFISFTLTI